METEGTGWLALFSLAGFFILTYLWARFANWLSRQRTQSRLVLWWGRLVLRIARDGEYWMGALFILGLVQAGIFLVATAWLSRYNPELGWSGSHARFAASFILVSCWILAVALWWISFVERDATHR